MARDDDPATLIHVMATRARVAARVLAGLSTVRKAAGLRAAAATIRSASDDIMAANTRDMTAGRENGLSGAMLDRLMLDADRIEGVAAAVEAVASLADPVGAVIDEQQRPNGLRLTRIRVPLGVVGIVYESRPNVTADAGRCA